DYMNSSRRNFSQHLCHNRNYPERKRVLSRRHVKLSGRHQRLPDGGRTQSTQPFVCLRPPTSTWEAMENSECALPDILRVADRYPPALPVSITSLPEATPRSASICSRERPARAR